MNPQEWQKAKAILAEAMLRPAAERFRFLEESCDDPQLRIEIAALLERASDLQPSPGTASSDASGVELFADPDDERPFAGNARFAVQRQIGIGAFGSVYQAWDREHQAIVAIKVLRRLRAELLSRFKREFRALADLRHPNLVQLYELFSDDVDWFFSMELVRGEDFLSHVRADGVCQENRLRPAVAQLAAGIQALHAAGRLHRDLKPANALVTDAGRVVILDFGLVSEFEPSHKSFARTVVAGTPSYMAPEQFAGHVSEASDWCAFGIMLFEALTGRLPFNRPIDGRPEWDAIQPQSISPSVPSDLNELSRSLLRARPEERPSGRTILEALSVAPIVNPGATVEARPEVDHFVGRSGLIQELERLLSATQEGGLRVALVSGRSGIGKTALVSHFLSNLDKTDGAVLCLRGRCYEFESVPYKGLDALVDELGRHLESLPSARVEPLLTRDALLLATLFPVLGKVKAIAQAPARAVNVSDAQELRQRSFGALRELLARLSDRGPLVVWVDDVQWADRDSCSFLAELCAPPQQPPLLLILTYRSEEIGTNATLAYLFQMLGSQRHTEECHELAVGDLTPEESQEVLQRSLLPGVALSSDAQMKIVAEAAGHPLFLQQLTRFATDGSWAQTDDAPSRQQTALQRLLQLRIEALSGPARELLEFVCIAGQPLAARVLFAAAESRDAERAAALTTLVAERLARSSGAEDTRKVEPYHDQVRTAVVALLTPDQRKARHARLATILAEQPDIEPQVLVTHFEEAGDLDAAFETALQAARLTETQFAFDRAALFYQVALNTKTTDPARRADLFCRLAGALGLAGRGRDSAAAYLNAAAISDTSERLALERKAADQLMRSGYIDESLTLLHRLAQTVGVSVPNTPGQAVLGIVWSRVRTRLRLLRGVPAPRTSSAPADQLARLDLLKTGGIILNLADPVLGTYFQTRHILAALDLRDPVHLSVALSVESTVRLAGGKGHAKSAMALLDEAKNIAERTGDANALGFVLLVRAYMDYLTRQVPQGLKHSREAIAFLRDHCRGVAWELTACQVLRFWFLSWSGQVKEVKEELPKLLKDGIARGDVHAEVSIRLLSYSHYSYMADDRPDACIEETNLALSRWPNRGYQLQHYGALFSRVDSLLYIGNYAEARRLLLEDWDRMSKSFILRWESLLVMANFLRGRVALACLLDNPDDRALRDEVERYSRRLKRLDAPWCEPMGFALSGGLLASAGRRREAAQHLETAADGFEKVFLNAHAASARYFAGRLHGREHGQVLTNSATEFLASQNVVNHLAFVNALIPGSSK